MAGRKSKYSSNENIVSKKIWSVALYIRLSQEDADNGTDKQESNSVTSQKTLLNEFIEEHDDLIVYDTYIDDGFTGTDFNRPSFQRLLEDMRSGNINCVIVKDLSRLGRNYIEVGNYIEQVFPLFNIRFIAINDSVDSFKNPASTNTILVPFKNLINDEYCRDTSIKIRTSLNGKKKKGEFIGAFPSYGYIKDPKDKHKLIIDEVAADIVKKIFNWNVNEGLGKIAICHRLNDLGVLNPTGHKKIELEQNYNNYGIQDNTYTWTPSTVRNILNNEVYIGNTVQGKRRTKSYKVHKVEAVPKEEWVRVEHTHEPIIDKETFEKAHELSRRDTKVSQKTKELSVWAGFLKCADCKRAMNKKSSTNKSGSKYEYYICSTYRKKSNNLCTKHSIKVENLEKAVLKAINLHIYLLIDTEEIVKQINESTYQNTKNENIENMIIAKQNEISKISNFKRTLYEDWKNKDITREEYLEYKQKYENDIERLKENIKRLENEKQKYENQNQSHNAWIEKFKNQKGIAELSRDIMMELIDCIYVHENGNITIKFKFEDEFKRCLDYIENNKNVLLKQVVNV
ncbi:MAG TPA: recombinase family protein [Clostridiaceae bacterium]|nr:recombinase family protein [Clostridiaceae bacterium]